MANLINSFYLKDSTCVKMKKETKDRKSKKVYNIILKSLEERPLSPSQILEKIQREKDEKGHSKYNVNSLTGLRKNKTPNDYFGYLKWKELTDHFIPTRHQKYCTDLSVYGVTGSGKTLITKLVF